jgi:thioredoxin 1
MAIDVTDATFEEKVLNSDVPVFVDFWAIWCGPCRMIHPIMDQISEEYAGKVTVAKVDVDKERQYAAQYGVRNIPTVILFHKGEVVDKIVGVAPKSKYTDLLEGLI